MIGSPACHMELRWPPPAWPNIPTLTFGPPRPPDGPSRPIVVAPKVDIEQVLVASQDLPMGTVVNEGATSWQDWPKAAVSEFMITKSGGADSIDDVNGSMTRVAFVRGE